jgi:hypothetical protein
VAILDREGLESVACECYGVIKQQLDRVIALAVNGDQTLATV